MLHHWFLVCSQHLTDSITESSTLNLAGTLADMAKLQLGLARLQA